MKQQQQAQPTLAPQISFGSAPTNLPPQSANFQMPQPQLPQPSQMYQYTPQPQMYYQQPTPPTMPGQPQLSSGPTPIFPSPANSFTNAQGLFQGPQQLYQPQQQPQQLQQQQQLYQPPLQSYQLPPQSYPQPQPYDPSCPPLTQMPAPQGYPFVGQNPFGNIFSPEGYGIGVRSSGLLHLISKSTEEECAKKVVAVIITICGGSSYDHLFSSVEQKCQEGTRVVVYGCPASEVHTLARIFGGGANSEMEHTLMEQIGQVDPRCVVINWECCSNFSNSSFTGTEKPTWELLLLLLRRGYMAMFSDFSLKAFINLWSNMGAQDLGRNPFLKTGEYGGQFELKFKASDLKECPSAQLQMVGLLADNDMCNVTAMGGTIVYSVNKTAIDNDFYKLQVLTVASSMTPPSEELTCQIGEHRGCAGHVLLKFHKGGSILTSMGHWAELMRIDTSEKKLFEVARQEYGEVEAARMQAAYACMAPAAQSAYCAQQSVNFIQNQAPCLNMNKF